MVSYNLVIIGPDNGLLPAWHQAITWKNANIMLIQPSRTNFSEISIGIFIQKDSFKDDIYKMPANLFWV